MTDRIVLFGATGYTGALTARAMVKRGLRPALAGRRPDVLEQLSAELGGLETAVADAAEPETVRALVEAGDVLVTTVGPMARSGEAALTACLDAGAHYVDSTGESAFVRRIFEEADSIARERGCLLLPAMAYDSVPGNLAASLAIRMAGVPATSVRVGYFVGDARRGGLLGGLGHMSAGSRATFLTMALEPSFAWRHGQLHTERGSARVGVFRVDGVRRRGLSFGTTEAFSLPRVHPRIQDIEVYFGWFEGASRMLQVASVATSALRRLPWTRSGMNALLGRLAPGSSGGPADETTESLFIAEALDSAGEQLAQIRLEGINGYLFSANMLAWAAEQVASGNADGTGARGPLEAFDIKTLEAGVATAGIARVNAMRPAAA